VRDSTFGTICKQAILHPAFRVVMAILGWLTLTRAVGSVHQFFPSFLIWCIALLQFRLSLEIKSKVPFWIKNLGIILYAFGIAISLFALIFDGLVLGYQPNGDPCISVTPEYPLLEQFVQLLFGTNSCQLVYLWLGTFLVTIFDWCIFLTPKEESIVRKRQNPPKTHPRKKIKVTPNKNNRLHA
jgi:hypothetical protein